LKIAITADLHLTTLTKNPERYHVLSDILKQCEHNRVQLLIIAGDLFNKTMANYTDFEDVYQRDRPDDLMTVIIPANHDHNLESKQIGADGLVVYHQAVLQPLNDSSKVLFIPYHANQTMGEAIAPFSDQLRGERWILIGHGDWIDNRNTSDPYEKGSYMPLTRTDLAIYKPELVFLGHIHLAQILDNIYYPGSPCPLNISETGPRYFLLLDTKAGEVTPKRINSVLEYYDEQFVMVPGTDDLELLLQDIHDRVQEWDIKTAETKNIQVRVKINGTAISDRKEILAGVKKTLEPFSLYRDQDPILENLYHNSDPDRAAIAREFKFWLDNLEWDIGAQTPTKSQILVEGLKTIYGVDR
jgi:DNA repair exonuclease SbcCD nuclease subunit